MKNIAKIAVYVTAVVFFVASLFDQGEQAVMVTSFDGIRIAFAFAIIWFQAGGNMIPRIGVNQAAEAWAGARVGK